MSTRLALGTLTLAALCLFAGQAFATPIPSCFDYAKTLDGPGASPNCAPMILENDEAFKLLRAAGTHKIGSDYYFFLSPKDVEEIPTKELWGMLFTLVSSVLSLYGDNSDVYIARRPATVADARSTAYGRMPPSLLLARARYNRSATRKARRSGDFPPDHHRRLYTLIVY